MTSPPPDPRDDLIAELQRELAEFKRRVEQLTQENQQLRRAVGTSATGGRPPSGAPFRRVEHEKIPKDEPKRPDGPAGHVGVNRPTPDRIDETIVVPLDACPLCGGRG